MTAPLFQRILVPVDGSATSTKGLKEAIDLARLSGGRIRLLHVVDDLPLLTAGAGAFVAEAVAVLRDAGEQVLRTSAVPVLLVRGQAGDPD